MIFNVQQYIFSIAWFFFLPPSACESKFTWTPNQAWKKKKKFWNDSYRMASMSLKLALAVPRDLQEWPVKFRACWTAEQPGTGTALGMFWKRPWRALPWCSGRRRSVSACGWRSSRGSTRTKTRPRTPATPGSPEDTRAARGGPALPRPAPSCRPPNRRKPWRHME